MAAKSPAEAWWSTSRSEQRSMLICNTQANTVLSVEYLFWYVVSQFLHTTVTKSNIFILLEDLTSYFTWNAFLSLLCLFQAYIKIYQGEELPHPKSMLQVHFLQLPLLLPLLCWCMASCHLDYFMLHKLILSYLVLYYLRINDRYIFICFLSGHSRGE